MGEVGGHFLSWIQKYPLEIGDLVSEGAAEAWLVEGVPDQEPDPGLDLPPSLESGS